VYLLTFTVTSFPHRTKEKSRGTTRAGAPMVQRSTALKSLACHQKMQRLLVELLMHKDF
jgi:hypothetical protein